MKTLLSIWMYARDINQLAYTGQKRLLLLSKRCLKSMEQGRNHVLKSMGLKYVLEWLILGFEISISM